MPDFHSPAWTRLRRALAGALARSRIDTTDEIMVLTAFLRDLGRRQSLAPSQVRRRWKEYVERDARQQDALLRLEVAFPFCPQVCSFCLLKTRIPSEPKQLAENVAELCMEMDYFGPTFTGSRFQSVWWGRGTPSMLSPDQLRTLMTHLRSSFTWEPDSLVGIECDPTTVDPQKLHEMRGLGFNHINYGVQSFSRSILDGIKRRNQTESGVHNAMLWSRQAGFDSLNLDLVLGLGDESVDDFLAGFRKLTILRPNAIAVFTLMLTEPYMKATGARREAHSQRLQAMLPEALEGMRKLAAAADYEAESLRPDEGVWHLVSRETPAAVRERWARSEGGSRAISRLSLGLRGRSEIFGRMLYERLMNKFVPADPIYRARTLKTKEGMAFFVLEAFNKRSRVDFDAFEAAFSRDIRDALGLELALLRKLGKIELDDWGVRFLPSRQTERIFYASIVLWESILAQFDPDIRPALLVQQLEHDLGMSRSMDRAHASLV